MQKVTRGPYDCRVDIYNELLLVKLKDNKVCCMAANYDMVEPWNIEQGGGRE